MTCENFSKQNGKVFCKMYGVLEATPDKIRECQSDSYRCFQEANKSLKDSTRRSSQDFIDESCIPSAVLSRRQNSIYV